jgi:hypothetical protein
MIRKGVGGRLYRSQEVDLDVIPERPLIDGLSGELRAIVATD